MAHSFICTSTEPIVETDHGKVRGFILDGIYTFHGIRYAKARRWQMPEEVDSWTGIKDALSYGAVCPMVNPETSSGEILCPHRYWVKDENCQYLNIWSPAIGQNAKKAVMVWLHGGGYNDGSSIEQLSYEGMNLAFYQDVVVVSINHRLNILGYLNLEPYSGKYANSGNAGQADIEAALRWIQKNIAAFGGDPDNVTIFGQSGGGGKVQTLLQTPSADGLYHKGIIMSGILGDFMNPADYDPHPLMDRMLKDLGIALSDIEKLEEVPYPALSASYRKAMEPLMPERAYIGGVPTPNSYYLGDPLLETDFRENAKKIPLIVGTVFGEFSFNIRVDQKDRLTDAERLETLRDTYGADSELAAEEFLKAYPGKNITDLVSLDGMMRTPTVRFVKKRAGLGGAPVYNYLFSYNFPIDDGRPAWHCSDIAFFFHNLDTVVVGNKAGVSDRLEEQMSSSFANFAKYGDPNSGSLPRWAPSSEQIVRTMIFDAECRVGENYDDKLYEVCQKHLVNPFLKPKKEGDIALH